jgi:hypothetical protein
METAKTKGKIDLKTTESELLINTYDGVFNRFENILK